MKDREIEVKLEVVGASLAEVASVLEEYLDGYYLAMKIERGIGRDTFWLTPDAEADFIRLREDRDGCEMTVKANDNFSILNRMEKNVKVRQSFEETESLLISALGEPRGSLVKSYQIYDASRLIYCAYVVVNDAISRVFVEVEGGQEKDVIFEAARVKRFLEERGQVVFQCNKSLIEMFILSTPKAD